MFKIEPVGLWDYYTRNKDKLLKSQDKVAENKDFGTEIYVTTDEETGWMELSVWRDDVMVYSEACVNRKDAEKTARWLYDTYLTNNAIAAADSFEAKVSHADELDARDLEIDEREDELSDAFTSLLAIIAGDSMNLLSLDFDEICDDVKEHTLEYIARKHGIDIYRPMYLVDAKNNEEFFAEYPYDNMIFEDPDNPIYK